MNLRGVSRTLSALGIAGVTFAVTALPLSAQSAVSAVNDAATVSEDASVTINVLANDTGTGLTLQSVTDPPHGTAAISGGQVVYTPDQNFHGTDTFAYTVTDGTTSVGAAVTVTVTSVNDAPVANADAATVTTGSTKAIDVLANDTDVDGDVLVAELQSNPSHGTATVDPVTKKVTYVPAAGYTGSDSFTYRASDGTAVSNTVTVIVTVKAADSNPGNIGLNPRVIAVCDANPGDARLEGLCNVYRSFDMPSWARGKIGLVILKLAPKQTVTDRVLEICDGSVTDHVQWLCSIYRAEQLPPGIQKLVGKQIISEALGDSSNIKNNGNKTEDDHRGRDSKDDDDRRGGSHDEKKH